MLLFPLHFTRHKVKGHAEVAWRHAHWSELLSHGVLNHQWERYSWLEIANALVIFYLFNHEIKEIMKLNQTKVLN